VEVEEYTPQVFDSIHGRLRQSEPARAVITAAGIGYEISIPLSTYETLPPVDEDVSLLLHLVVRETEWRLFGFATPGERDVFRAVLRVNGVGPTMAISLLSGFAPADLCAAVTQSDVRALTRVKGVGKKTAERIVVELRDVVSKELVTGPVSTPAGTAASDLVEDAVRALQQLGLDPAEARRRVEARASDADQSLSDLVRSALRG
jgi:Holliday junction DNA helicase RuvA